MAERSYSRRRALALMATAAGSFAIGESPAKLRTINSVIFGSDASVISGRNPDMIEGPEVKADGRITLVIPEVARAGNGGGRYDGKYVVTLPEVAAGDVSNKAEYRRETKHIARKPEWTTDFLLKDKEPLKRIDGVKKPLIALTIDDGFAKNSLRSILNTAREKGITYTDFMKGQQRELYPDFVQELVDSEIVEFGTHTQFHRDERNSDKTGVPPTNDFLVREMFTMPEAFLNKFGQTSLPFHRPPGGSSSIWTMQVAAGLGLRTFNWAASADWSTTTDVRSLRPGDIVLMHYRDESAAQFPRWIDAVRARGLEPAALSNVFAVAA